MNRELIVTTLEAMGYIVLEAEDGQGLLERVKVERPALIIMDVQLPYIDGFTLTQQLKTDIETRAIPVCSSPAPSVDLKTARGLWRPAAQTSLPNLLIYHSFCGPSPDFCRKS